MGIGARADRPAGIRYCGRCKQDAEFGAGQSYCKACRAERSRARRTEFNAGVEVLRHLTSG